jgi:hypothetical protein
MKKQMTKGMTEKEAAAMAIKEANGVVMNANESKGVYGSYKNKQILNYDTKLTLHQEKAHLVAPVVMMVEGVHSGSQGPLLHEISELGKFPASWNGRPIVIYHPEDEDGEPISANSPEIVDSVTVGRVYNTFVDDNKLKAEAWFDEDKLNMVSPETLQDINDGKEIEVSLGMFTENEMVEGIYEEEKYVGIAHNHRPDHLAILPDQIGACSCKDGCGVGANQNNKDMERTKKPKTVEMIDALSLAGYSVNKITNNVELDYQKRISMAYDALRRLESHVYNYLEELYDSYLIYTQSDKNESKMYKQDYKIDDGKIDFVGAPVEVHKKVEYVANTNVARTKFSTNNKKEDKNMPNGNDCPSCLKKINALIANEQSLFVEADRPWLLTQDESYLDKLTPVIVEKEVEKKVEVNKLTDAQKAALAYGERQLKARRDGMVKAIQDNTDNGTWDEATLVTMTEDVLERIYKSVVKEEEEEKGGNYSLNGNAVNINTADAEEILLPGGIEFETKK